MEQGLLDDLRSFLWIVGLERIFPIIFPALEFLTLSVCHRGVWIHIVNASLGLLRIQGVSHPTGIIIILLQSRGLISNGVKTAEEIESLEQSETAGLPGMVRES